MSKQCELRSPSGGRLVTWLPAEHAVPGRCLSLKGDDGAVVPRMTVAAVFGTALPTAYVKERSRDWTKTRRASDI
jgi:hypothetical protein